MEITNIKEIISKGEITTPSHMSQVLRKPEPTCKNMIKEWSKVWIERQCIYVKDPNIAKKLKDMILSGTITNPTKLRYDTSSYRKAVMNELTNNYDLFKIGKRSFYIKKNA